MSRTIRRRVTAAEHASAQDERARLALANRISLPEDEARSMDAALGRLGQDVHVDRYHFATQMRTGRDALAKEYESARNTWRASLVDIASACGVSSVDVPHEALTRAIIAKAKAVLEESRTLRADLERERKIVDALVGRGRW